jgi:ATP-dependent helicase HrpA
MIGFPALAEHDGNISIRLFDTREAAETSMRGGVRQLLRFELKEQMKQLEKDLSGQGGKGGKDRYLAQAAFQLHTLIKPDLLKEDILNAVADRAFIADDALPRSEKEFVAQRQRARARLPAVAEALAQIVQSVANEYQSLMTRLSPAGGTSKVGMQKTGAAGGSGAGNPGADLMIQLRNLIYPGFLSATPWKHLHHLPRYLKGMVLRLDKYGANPERDARHAAAIAGLWNRYEQRLEKHRKAGTDDPKLVEFRWQIEELRISLFAQELKTPYPVSVKRLQKLWEEVSM